VTTYKTVDEALSPEATTERARIYAMWDPTSENCKKVMDFIKSYPFCSVFPNELCLAADGLPVTVHPLYIESKGDIARFRDLFLDSNKLETIAPRLNNESLSVFIAVAEFAWNILDSQSRSGEM